MATFSRFWSVSSVQCRIFSILSTSAMAPGPKVSEICTMTLIDVPQVSATSRQYKADGVIQVAAVLTSSEVDEIRDAFMAQMEVDRTVGFDDGVSGDDPLARFPRIVHPHRHRDLEIGALSRRLMIDRRIWSLVEELIGPACAAQSMFYFKPPGGRGQALHQDNLFLRAAPETCLAVWIAIDDCDAENGGLTVVPGSHTRDHLPGDRGRVGVVHQHGRRGA